MRLFLLLCHLVFMVAIGGPVRAAGEVEAVNRLREAAGLPVLVEDRLLAAAAARHAAYLDRHREPGGTGPQRSAHLQHASDDGFSGETPADRALAAGYAHREVLENVSMGYADAASALTALMGAIYHRLTFLDPESDQIGVAVGERSRVFLLGRSDITRLCRAAPEAARYRRPVDCLGQPMKREHYLGLCATLPAQALFRPSHPVSCPNGVRLDAGFMEQVCARPPREARFGGHGRYYAPCDNGTRLDADWFDGLCASPPEGAAYAASGHYYEICEGPQRVHAEWLEAQCADLPEQARFTDSGRYRRPCADELDVRVEYLEELDAQRRAGLPAVVVWPQPDARDVPPAFFIEEPDPLPDLAVSGYPLSIQFNPAAARQVRLESFRLFRVQQQLRSEIGAVRLLDRETDPHGLLGGHEFALFPLERLAWGTDHVAVVEARVDGEARRIEWRFRTLGGDRPVLTAHGPRDRFVIQSARDYLLYLPPQDGRPYTVLGSRTEHLRGNRVELEVVDPNTLRVRIEVRHCERIRVEFDGGQVVELVPAGCDGGAAMAGIMRENTLDRR